MDDLVAEFIAETEDSLNDLDAELLRLEQDPGDEEILGNIFRIMHTIKGTCGFLGLNRLASIAHSSENILDNIRDGKMQASPEAVALVLESIDAIKDLVTDLQDEGAEPDGDDSELIGRLDAFVASGGVGTEAAAPEPAPEPEPEVKAEDEVAPPEPKEGEVSLEELEAAFLAAPGPDDEDEPTVAPPEPKEGEVSLEELEAAFQAAPGPDDEDEPTVAPPEPKEGEVSLEELEAAFQAAPGPDDEEPQKPEEPVKEVAKAQAIAEGLAVSKPEAPKPPAAKKPAATPAANPLIRVNLSILEDMMQMVSELVLTRNQLLQVTRGLEDEALNGPMQRLNHITSELQDCVMQTRMQPVSNAWTKFPRLIRDLAKELDKKMELVQEGGETELDRQVLEMIKDPLTHMVRNSADHGLEMPDKRLAAGKPEKGTVTLRAYHEGGHIIIEIQDDGAGIPIDKVKEKCLANGVLTEAQIETLSDQQIIQNIFAAGFSTAEKVTSVSGRGVGMDVVRTNIEKIGGTVEVKSEQGKGSTFFIKIPLTLAIVSILIVESGGKRFAVPQINVQEIVRANGDGEYVIETVKEVPVLRLRGTLLPVLNLGQLLQLPEQEERPKNQGFVAVCRVGAHAFGLLVDRVYDTEEIVVKPMAPCLRDIPYYSGSTILGDGSVILILDVNGLTKELGQVEDASAIEPQTLDQQVQAKPSRFLLFEAGNEVPKAVSLDMVSRLEEIDASEIEFSTDIPVLQYRDGLMRLVTLNDSYALPDSGIIEVIVFQFDTHSIGLYVSEIKDIIDFVYDIKMPSEVGWCLGSTVIEGVTTEIVDVGFLISQAIGKDMVLDVEAFKPTADKTPEVLLVEDSPFFIQLLVPVLEEAGYNVKAVESGEHALVELNKRDFDIIVTDIEMPVMNGMELAMQCKTMPEKAHIPIVAFTSKSERNIGDLATQAGILAVVSKTDREGLLRNMRDYLGAAQYEELT